TAGGAESRPAARRAARVRPRPPEATAAAAVWRGSETQAPVGWRSAQRPRADGAAQPEDQQDNQHQAEQSAAAVICNAPAGAFPVVVAAATAEEQNQHDDQENQHDVTQ